MGDRLQYGNWDSIDRKSVTTRSPLRESIAACALPDRVHMGSHGALALHTTMQLKPGKKKSTGKQIGEER